MAATATQVILDTPAAEFRLPATDGKTYALDDVAGEKGTVVVFICNHCPYVKAVIDRMVADARVLMSEGVGFQFCSAIVGVWSSSTPPPPPAQPCWWALRLACWSRFPLSGPARGA